MKGIKILNLSYILIRIANCSCTLTFIAGFNTTNLKLNIQALYHISVFSFSSILLPDLYLRIQNEISVSEQLQFVVIISFFNLMYVLNIMAGY
jgi:hypothetical protein